MNKDAEKVDLAKRLLNTESETILEQVKSILSQQDKDWWDEISDKEKAAINEGIAQLDRGEGIPHHEVIKRYKKWRT